jgi:hypothetical protein
MSTDRYKRLERLERESHPLSGPLRTQPSDHEERYALGQGLEAWRNLMRSHGWTDEDLDDELEWTAIVNKRCDESGLEDFEILQDWIDYYEFAGEWDGYPGPGYWGEGGSYA